MLTFLRLGAYKKRTIFYGARPANNFDQLQEKKVFHGLLCENIENFWEKISHLEASKVHNCM